MNIAERKRRPRRIAADEAHAWARNLRLGNPYAKLVLSMLTIYVNGEGSCFVAISTLAEDCELAENTVRRRLAFLEEVGVLARIPQWRDENGRINTEGRGKRTTDDIRLLVNADPDDIEARALGNGNDEGGAEDGEFRGSNETPDEPLNPVSPSLGVQQPSHCGESLTSEPEPEKIPPNPPSGGGQSDDQEFEGAISDAIRAYPEPITDLPKLRVVMSAMAPAERRIVILGMRGYAAHIAECDRKGKRRAVKDAHRWVAAGMWQGYVPAGEKAEAIAQQSSIAIDSQDGKAWAVLHKIAHIRPFENGGFYLLPRPLSAQALAFAQAPSEDAWEFISGNNFNQCGAWTELISRELTGKNRPPLAWDRNPNHAIGFFAPWPWPPLRDGSICTGPPQELSKEDAHELTK